MTQPAAKERAPTERTQKEINSDVVLMFILWILIGLFVGLATWNVSWGAAAFFISVFFSKTFEPNLGILAQSVVWAARQNKKDPL